MVARWHTDGRDYRWARRRLARVARRLPDGPPAPDFDRAWGSADVDGRLPRDPLPVGNATEARRRRVEARAADGRPAPDVDPGEDDRYQDDPRGAAVGRQERRRSDRCRYRRRCQPDYVRRTASRRAPYR